MSSSATASPDSDRREFLDAHLPAAHAAVVAGADLRGCQVWTLLDNFEWAEGYGPRFGIVHVDMATQENVLVAVRQLSYVPNSAARSLVTRRADAIALVVPDTAAEPNDDPVVGTVIRVIGRDVEQAGKRLVLMRPHSRADGRRAYAYLAAGHVDGLVLVPRRGEDPFASDPGMGIPTVSLGRLGTRPAGYEETVRAGRPSPSYCRVHRHGRGFRTGVAEAAATAVGGSTGTPSPPPCCPRNSWSGRPHDRSNRRSVDVSLCALIPLGK